MFLFSSFIFFSEDQHIFHFTTFCILIPKTKELKYQKVHVIEWSNSFLFFPTQNNWNSVLPPVAKRNFILPIFMAKASIECLNFVVGWSYYLKCTLAGEMWNILTGFSTWSCSNHMPSRVSECQSCCSVTSFATVT